MTRLCSLSGLRRLNPDGLQGMDRASCREQGYGSQLATHRVRHGF